MKTIISSFGGSLLSREQMKKVVGGGGGECDACTQSECSGGCDSTGNVCGWVQGACVCTYIAVPSHHE